MSVLSIEQVKEHAGPMLEEVVRREQNSPDFQIQDWSVSRLSNKGLINPQGLLLFEGQGRDARGTRSWSVVLKLLMEKNDAPIHDRWYWRREAHAVESELYNEMAGQLRAPRYYGLYETEEAVWIWMEYLREAGNQPWTLDDYAFVAHLLGRWNGRYLTGTPLPDYPWLTRDVVLHWYGPENPTEAWQEPAIRQYLPEVDIARHIRMCEQQEAIAAIFHRLPQTFAHLDCTRRNLFLCRDDAGQPEVVALDWALCGVSALGSELGPLILGSALYGEFPYQQIDALETTCFAAYLRGLREAGWGGPEEQVRLGYLAFTSLLRTPLLPWTLEWFNLPEQLDTIQPIFGMIGRDISTMWMALYPRFLDQADEIYRLSAEFS